MDKVIEHVSDYARSFYHASGGTLILGVQDKTYVIKGVQLTELEIEALKKTKIPEAIRDLSCSIPIDYCFSKVQTDRKYLLMWDANNVVQFQVNLGDVLFLEVYIQGLLSKLTKRLPNNAMMGSAKEEKFPFKLLKITGAADTYILYFPAIGEQGEFDSYDFNVIREALLTAFKKPNIREWDIEVCILSRPRLVFTN